MDETTFRLTEIQEAMEEARMSNYYMEKVINYLITNKMKGNKKESQGLRFALPDGYEIQRGGTNG